MDQPRGDGDASHDRGDATPAGLLRGEGERDHQVSSMELFFDLVFVFAITQLSHLLLTHLDLGGALQTALLLLALWWAWVDTAWLTNWFDPDRRPVRLMLIGAHGRHSGRGGRVAGGVRRSRAVVCNRVRRIAGRPLSHSRLSGRATTRVCTATFSAFWRGGQRPASLARRWAAERSGPNQLSGSPRW